MKKILLGLIAAGVIAAGGYVGFNRYIQHRVANEVEAAFEQIRATGAKATHGKVSYDLRSRTLTVAGIVSESAAQPSASIKIANLTASGVRQQDATQFSADSIELIDVEIGVTMPTAHFLGVTYKVPRIAVKDYSGPNGPGQLPASSSLLDLYRFAFEQLASIRATSITAPTLTGKMTFDAGTSGGASDGEFVYSGLTMDGLKDGKIASMKVDGFQFKFNEPASAAKPMTGNLANLAASDIDVGAMAAIFDAHAANDDREYRIYRQITAGPYIITSPQGINVRIDVMSMEDIGFRPSHVRLPALLAMMPPAGAAPPTPAQTREMLDGLATLYEGIRVGNAEMHGLSIETPKGPLKLSSMRFNFEHGKIGELAFEGFDARPPKGPIKVGRFALTSLDITGLMRTSAQFSARKPSAEQALALLPLIEGAEVKDLSARYKDTGKPINIGVLSLNWGQFVGPIPSKVHLVAKMSAPLGATDLGQQMLVAAGIDTMTIDTDLGAAWTEASRSFALEPVKFEIGGLAKATARISLDNVPREAFSADPVQAIGAAAQIEAGTIELTLRDLGGVDLAVARFARAQDVGRDDARRAILDGIKAQGETSGSTNPDADALLAAISRFVETPGQTLVIKLTPRAKAPALQLLQLLKTDPLMALAQFRIEASTGL